MKDENNNQDCNGVQNCRGCIGCDNSTWCNNSTRCDNSTACDNSAYCIYCCDLVLKKFMIFNKSLKTKRAWKKVKDKIVSQFGYYKHPKDLTQQDINWLKENIKQFNQKVLDKIIQDSIKSDKPKELTK
jgi:hypothetical protein